MSPKAHGSTAMPVQQPLRWGVKSDLAKSICCHNRNGAEPNMYFTECMEFTKQLRWQRGVDLSDVEPIVFYDSVSGMPLFVAPMGRDVDAFLSESLRHGWPSFRIDEVVWDNVRVLEDFEVVSTAGTHLGHQMTDPDGTPRFCINLCSVAGHGDPDGASADGVNTDRALELRGAWPVLHELADAGSWRGRMHYATGPDALSVAPFVLDGTTRVELTAMGGPPDDEGGSGNGASDGASSNGEPSVECIGQCSLTSSAVMPNGVERTVAMLGPMSAEPGSTVRLDKEGGGGPIYILLSEVAGARTVLVREMNSTTDEVVMASTLVLVGENDSLELIQTAHELTQRPAQRVAASDTNDDGSSSTDPAALTNAISGVQIWRMVPAAEDDDGEIEHDTEAYMYSGSEL